jgi:hypothetical protein
VSKRTYTPGVEKEPTEQVHDLYIHGEPVLFGHFGHVLKLSGLFFQGEGADQLLLFPTADPDIEDETLWIRALNVEELHAILRQTDDPVIFENDETGVVKAIVRKAQRAVSGAVQQAVWARDDCQCMYCGRYMSADVQITVDHFVPLEEGGQGVPANLLTSCRQCNKAKGRISPGKFCNDHDLDFSGLEQYLAGKASKHYVFHLTGTIRR